jgi:hypothetical protein
MFVSVVAILTHATVLSAFAYESDTLTDREQPLPDVTAALDARVNDVIAIAIADTNRRTGCDGDPERAQRLLAHHIHTAMSTNELVNDRGGLRAFGFDRYSAWIEKGAVPRRSFLDRSDVFGSLTFRESPLLSWAGVCSTVLVNGVLVGTDKLDHFFEEGYNAWRRARYGEEPEEAVLWATRTENGKYGLESSETFSFGDLRADSDGFEFYDTLVGSEGMAEVGADGCLQPAESFTWAVWVDEDYDEVLNPPVYTPSVQQGVTRHLYEHRDEYCASYAQWGGPEYEARLADVLNTSVDYVGSEAPPRTDPYRLDELCSGWKPSEVIAHDAKPDAAGG